MDKTPNASDEKLWLQSYMGQDGLDDHEKFAEKFFAEARLGEPGNEAPDSYCLPEMRQVFERLMQYKTEEKELEDWEAEYADAYQVPEEEYHEPMVDIKLDGYHPLFVG